MKYSPYTAAVQLHRFKFQLDNSIRRLMNIVDEVEGSSCGDESIDVKLCIEMLRQEMNNIYKDISKHI